ncbi:hypothetical protein [Sedimenticola selenatireducens]|uniref:Uncharacterized protein n=1 Tax=Sedimenticola selenatireducens TaxID=191960 RepID=A0A2N6CWC5_9GAMM|nr:hypothetical protein [Sedimenticola selenatireducens]PLX61557.1 MAG: hypothetical protein C0630_10340 [Sedimenticola selenatireducens]
MNLEVLHHLVKNDESLIETLAIENGIDQQASIGVAKLLDANGGDLSILSNKQRFHFEKCIKPLIENVQCQGVFGPETCTGNGIVDDELLLGCYITGEFKCQLCQHDAGMIEAE